VELSGWVLDKSAAARADDPGVAAALGELASSLFICPVGELEQLYSARSSRDYDRLKVDLRAAFGIVRAPADGSSALWCCNRILPTTTACGTERPSPTC
jgi:hypothetical protein